MEIMVCSLQPMRVPPAHYILTAYPIGHAGADSRTLSSTNNMQSHNAPFVDGRGLVGRSVGGSHRTAGDSQYHQASYHTTLVFYAHIHLVYMLPQMTESHQAERIALIVIQA